MGIGTASTGTRYAAQSPWKRLVAADKPGQHLWIITAAWECRPEWFLAGGPIDLDAENLLIMTVPACYKCERVHSRAEAKRPCRGSIDEIQP